jgi:hypothetical protein
MTTPLDKTLRRQINIDGQDYIVALSPEGLKITRKGRRKGLELTWNALVTGDAALALALQVSVGRFAKPLAAKKPPDDLEREDVASRRRRNRPS